MRGKAPSRHDGHVDVDLLIEFHLEEQLDQFHQLDRTADHDELQHLDVELHVHDDRVVV